MFERTAEQDTGAVGEYGAVGYQQHQGKKIEKRFDSKSYIMLSKAMDSHDVGRNRGSIEQALSEIRANTLVIGISSDILFPVKEQIFLAENIRGAQLEIIDSPYGHDGFLTEGEAITNCILKVVAELPF